MAYGDSVHSLIARYGFRVPRGEYVTHPDQAVLAASQIGYPVALKVASPDIPHKTDVGGVVLDCRSEAEVREAFGRIVEGVRDKMPAAQVLGVDVQEMYTGSLEVIIGLNNDPQFGPCIMFGLGGILVDLVGDVVWRVLPIMAADARAMIREVRGSELLSGFRGGEAVSEHMLVELLLNADALAADLGERLASVDLNPVAVRGARHMVLDVKVNTLDRGASRGVDFDTAPRRSHIGTFFDAASVALVGASGTPGKIGNAVLDSLVCHEYRGEVYPVNPHQTRILGREVFRDLSSIRGPLDLVVVTTALSLVPSLLEECAAKDIHNMVIVSGGGKELGDESARLEAEIGRMAADKQVRIIGCNCIGVFDGETRLDTFFQTHERMVRPRKGPIAMITQSGTVGAAFLEAVADVGVSRFVSYGNRIDVDEADLIGWLADDEATRVIACYVEGFENGRAFLRAARRASMKKPIVIYKAGRSREGAGAAASHTGFLGGSYKVALGAFCQAGLIAVDSFEELCATARTLALQPLAKGGRIGLISNGAGTMVQCLDLAARYGLELADLRPATRDRMAGAFPAYYQVHNPVDVTGSATSADYELGMAALLEDDGTDIVMPWFVFQDTPLDEGIVDVVSRLHRSTGKPIVCGATGGDYSRWMARMIWDCGVPVHSSVRDWVAGASGLCGGKPPVPVGE